MTRSVANTTKKLAQRADSAAEQALVREWQELHARYSRVSCALETTLQRDHGIGVSEFEALEALVCAESGTCRAQQLIDVSQLSQSA